MSSKAAEPRDWKYKANWAMNAARFGLIHLLCFAAIWTGVDWTAIALFAAFYAIRMFAITAGYHRYFAHRTYKMGRVMQFIMAFLSETSAQKGVLWWASHHRHHHKYSDQPEDVHSAKQDGFWHSHIGWIFSPDWEDTDESRVKDLARYPELRFIDKFWLLPPTLMGVAAFLIGGWSGLIVGFFWSTVAVWHVTFTINSLSHMIGKRRYETTDDSRNNWVLAILTFGEGWHNNHHHYQASANQGFYWWEVDITYYVLKAMSWVGLVSDLRKPPQHVIDDERHPMAHVKKTVDDIKTSAKKASEEASRRLDVIGEAAVCRVVELRQRAERTVDEIRMSAREASEEASRKIDELSEAAHCRYVEVSQAAHKAGEEASRKVDELTRGLQPEPALAGGE